MKLIDWLPEFVGAVSELNDLWLHEPLDGDATKTVGKVFLAVLDRRNGNSTDKEYEDRLKELEKEWHARMLDVDY